MTDERIADLTRRLAAGAVSRRRLLKGAAGAGLAVPTVVAGLGRTATASPRSGARLVARFQTDASTLVIVDNMAAGGLWITFDPGHIYEINPQAAMNVVYETLYHLPDSAEPDRFEPLLATGMPEVSADGTEVTITIQSGVTFHNTGNEMTAEDWVYSLNRTRTLKGNPSYLAEYWTSVEAVDPTTLKFTLPAPNPALVAILTSSPLSVVDSKTVIAQGGTGVAEPAEGEVATPGAGGSTEPDTAEEWLTGNSAGTGPFILTQWDPNTEVIIERNPDYWGDPPQLERMIWRNIAGANQQLQEVQTGNADIAFSLDPDAVEQVRSDPNLQLLEGATISLEYLALHTQEDPGGPLANVQLRQAIAYAIDYDGIIESLAPGAIRPATIVPLPMPGSEAVQANAYTTDLARAQELFNAAAGGGEVEITLSYRAEGIGQGQVSEANLAAKLQSDIQQIDGLTVNLNPMDANTWIGEYRASALQMTLAPWGPDFPDIQSYTEPFGRTGEGVARRVGYSNPTVDQTLDQIIAETDPAKKEELYATVQRTMIEDAPFIVLYQPTDRKPARAVVQGVTNHYLVGIQLRYASKTE